MFDFEMPDFGKYYRGLEVVFQFLLMTMMLLFGATFLVLPNRAIFRVFVENEVYITPAGFAIACFIFALICPFMLSPGMRKVSADWKASAAILATAPMLFYFMMVFFVMIFVEHSYALTPIFYLSNYALIILTPIAVFRGYRRWIEIIATIALCAIWLMLLAALYLAPELTLFNRFNAQFGTSFTIFHLSAITVLSIIGYIGMLFPLPRFSCRVRRVLFLTFESPVGLISVFYLYNAISMPSSAVIPPLAFINLTFLIALLGYALCPDGRRKLLKIAAQRG